jgi:hypothetical protein
MKRIILTLIVASGFAYADPNPKFNYVYIAHNPFVEQQAWRDYQHARHQHARRNKETTNSVTSVGTIKIGQNSNSPADLFAEKINRNRVAAK